MNIKKQIQSLINEASVYDSQGLYQESRQKYMQVVGTIQRNAHVIQNHKVLLNSVSNRIKRLETTLERMGNEPEAYQMPNIVLEVMKHQFSSAQDKDEAALEGALALAGFKQYESALEEFTKLLKVPSMRLEASKNILRCHLVKGRQAEATELFRHWRNSGLLGPEEMTELRHFFQQTAQSLKLDLELPQAEMKKPDPVPEARPPARIGSMALDFSSISLRLPADSQKQMLREFDIESQSEDFVSVLIPDHEKEIAIGLKKGTVLDPVQCFSTNAMFSGKATVIDNLPVISEAGAGHFRIDIKIQGI